MAETPPTSGRVGTFDGRYQYDHIFPRGRSGETLRAWIPSDNNRLVVIKRPAPQDAPPMRAAQELSIRTEKKALERLSGHPVLTELRATGNFRVGGQSHEYIVMDRAHGEILENIVLSLAQQGQRLPLLEMLVIVDELLDLLVLAHDQQVVYNDVDAKHLFWDRENYRLKVIDWGNAVLLDESGSHNNITRQADVHQVGQLLYFIITGGKRFESETSPDGEYAVIFGLDAPSAPSQLLAIITQATHPNLRRRYSTIVELRQSLSEIRRPLTERRQKALEKVDAALQERNSQQALQALTAQLDEIAEQDPGFPQVHNLYRAIQTQMQRLQTQSNIDAGRIYLDTANWPRAIETMLDLLNEADEESAPIIRFIVSAAELMDHHERGEAPKELAPALDELLRGDPQHAGWLLHNSDVELNQLLADRLSSYIPSVMLLRPALTRLRVEATQDPQLSEIVAPITDIEALLKQRDDEPSLKQVMALYRQIAERLTPIHPILQAADNDRLVEVAQRATQATKTLIHHLEQASDHIYSQAAEALDDLHAAASIDPMNPIFQELQDYFEEIQLAVEAIANFKPDEAGTQLGPWLQRVLNILQNYANDVNDTMLHHALNDLQSTANLWDQICEAVIVGQRVNINSLFIRIARQIATLNPMLAQWARDRGDDARSIEHIELLSPNQELAKRLIEAQRLWDQGKLRDAAYQAEGAFSLAQSEGELQAVKKLSELSTLPANWVEHEGTKSYELTSRTEKAITALFSSAEKQLLDQFTAQMKSENAYINSMQRGLIDSLQQHSSHAPRVLFLHYVFQGMLCVQEKDLHGANFWQKAALKVNTDGAANPAYAAFANHLNARQLIAEVEENLAGVNSIERLNAVRSLLNHPQANQWLGGIQVGVRQLEVAIKHWEDGEFKAAREAFGNAQDQLAIGAEAADIDISTLQQWVENLQKTAEGLHSIKLSIEEIAHTTSIPAPGSFINVDPRIEQQLMTIVVQTEETLGGDYVHQMRQWLSTYQSVMYTYSKDLPKADKLREFQTHFANLFINRHPTFRLYQIWREITQNLPDNSPTPITPPPMSGQVIEDETPTSTAQENEAPKSRGRNRNTPPPDENIPSFTTENDSAADVHFEDQEMPAATNIPWGVVGAVAVVLLGVIAFVLLGGFGEDDGTSDNNANNAGGNNPGAVLVDEASATPSPESLASQTLVPATSTPSVSPSQSVAASASPSNTATNTPSETATDIPTATASISPSPSPTNLPPSPTDEPPPPTENTESAAQNPPAANDFLAFDFLTALNESNTSTYSWNSVWFYNGVAGPWQLGELNDANQSGPVVVKIAADDMRQITGLEDAAEQLQRIELEMTLALPLPNDAEAIGSGIYFGLGVENADLERSSAEILIQRPNSVDIGVREDGRYNSLRGFPESNFTFTLSIERNDDGSLTMRYGDDILPYETSNLYPPGTPFIPVLYTSRGGVVIIVSEMIFSFEEVE